MKNKQVIIYLENELHEAAKELAKECGNSFTKLCRKALIEFLKKHNKEVPVKEL